MAILKGTRTEKNILTAFAGESQARNRYNFFAGKARKEGFVQISDVFEETANQEREHAKRLFKFLEGGEVEVHTAFAAGVIGSTAENLAGSASGEHHEWESMYPEFAATARDEGFDEIAAVLEAIAVAEKQHENRFLGLLANVQSGSVFKKESTVVWRCRNCGHVHQSKEAPRVCPACAHAQAHFELLAENW